MDGTRIWSSWADWLGIPRLTFMAVLGALIERGGGHRDPLALFRPGIDIEAEFTRRRAAGVADDLRVEDLYPDAGACTRRADRCGLSRRGIVGNRRPRRLFAALDVPLEFVASSKWWASQKPDPAFFARIAAELGLPPEEIAYVGDRLDNDVLLPAAAAGMAAIFIRRGPWAWIQAGRVDPPAATATIDRLDELPAVLAGLRS